jgi:hypothetical protein
MEVDLISNIRYLDNMPRSSEARSLSRVRMALEHILGLPSLRAVPQPPGGIDLLVHGPKLSFAVEWKSIGDAANVGAAVLQVGRFMERTAGKNIIPMVAVPYMGETGRRLCAEAAVSWIDLSGNAWIDAPGRQIHILGNRNRFASAGRPANVFAPRSSRVVRVLLMDPSRSFSQTELVSAAGVDKGRVSRIVRRMQAMDLLISERGGYRLKDPSVALEAWKEAYDFRQHDVLEGHVPVRDPEELLGVLKKAALKSDVAWALTGLAAAWRLTHFAMYRLTSLFAGQVPSAAWLDALGFVEGSRGANLWILTPTDDSVFMGARNVQGVQCVHPLQAYLDLKAHPERASEAATRLRPLVLGGVSA